MDLVAENLVFRPENEYHLNNVSFTMTRGKLYTILGRTLAGKTTLLKTIAGLIAPDSGSITYSGKEFGSLPVWKRNVAMVYQQFINYPHLTVFDNVAFPLKQRKVSTATIQQKVSQALQQVGLQGFEERKIQALSGGQQQRVALARSLVKEAELLLLDEPLVNLDYKLREQLRDEFRGIFNSGLMDQSILIYSSTDPVETMQLGGDVVVMDEGSVLQQAKAQDVFEHPADTRVALIANDPAMNLIAGEKTGGMIVINQAIRMDVPRHLKSLMDGRYTFGIRAADISIDKEGDLWEVELSEISGSETFIHLRNGEHSIVGLLEMVKDIQIGEKISVQFDTQWLYAFDQKGDLAASPFQKAD
ncbi:MAG: ABC transporter ATP-binding protein [bacterium]|jgi:glycerol transport system ATP-binding protein